MADMDRPLADRYRMESRIGQGGMAEVFRGFDPALDRTVAIKILVHPFDRDAGFVARFRREAQAAARLNHPNIVGVYDAGADGDTQFIVMEYVEGRTLASYMAGGGRPTTMQAVELCTKVAGALQVAHAQGIVHRDIKPANVMVTRAGEVKVMDFGIARMQTDATAPQTSSVIGTPAYFSPEQAQGQPVDARSDLYSLGCVLYEMVGHRQPFTGDTPVAIAYKQVNEVAPPPSTFNPDVTPALDAVVMKCMAKNPANRYQDAGELIADLDRVRQGLEVEATPLMPAAGAESTQVIARQPTEVLPPPEPEGSSSRIWLGVLIGLLVVALLAGGGYLLAQSLNNKDAPTTVQMPTLKNLTYEAARSQLIEMGFPAANISKDTRETTNPQQVGQVLAQTPAVGAVVDPATEQVTLTVGVLPATVSIPDLHCKTLQEAEAELPNGVVIVSHLTAATPDPSCQPAEIVTQDPAAGTDVIPNTDAASISMTINKAKAEINKLGLQAEFGGTTTPLPQCSNPPFVAMQDPAPGFDVPIGGSVTLFTGSEESPSPTATESPSP